MHLNFTINKEILEFFEEDIGKKREKLEKYDDNLGNSNATINFIFEEQEIAS